jgi:hypothetical protein
MTMITTRATMAARAKTAPARGLFSRKDLEGAGAAEVDEGEAVTTEVIVNVESPETDV